MTAIRLDGCRSDSLLGYLKAVGLLRLLAVQGDAAARGAWDGASFVIETAMSDGDVERFLLTGYSPTPVLGLWNNGAGFDGKDSAAGRTMTHMAATRTPRLEAYRRALTFTRTRYLDTGLMNQYLDGEGKIDKNKKSDLIRDLRSQCPEEMLPWLDASVIVTADGIGYPYLLGTGGNDGHLDFSVNFAARALDVCGDNPIPESPQLLHDAMYGTARAKLLPGAAIGQFSPLHAGGANATSGFDAKSLVNPWDYVLMIEGALLFSGSVGRRTDRSPGRPVFPFALRSVAGGYGSASGAEQARGEVWLPVWDGLASLSSVTDLLRKGRIDIPEDGARSVVRGATLASEAAAAVVTMGVALGVRRLERIAFVQRNGLAFSAAAAGPITVTGEYDRGIAVISRDTASWIENLRGRDLGTSAREALRRFDDELFRFPNIPANNSAARAHGRQELLVAVADLDRAIAHRDGFREANRSQPDILDTLDDGTPLHRLAAAIASLGAARRDTDTRDELRRAEDDAGRTLRALLEKRTRADASDPSAGWLRATCVVSSEDAAAFLAFDALDRARFNRLLRAYSLILLGKAHVALQSADSTEGLPAAYAVLKLVFDHPKARDEQVLRLLFTRNAQRALALAVRRARTIRGLPRTSDGYDPRPRDVSAVRLQDDVARWMAAALAIPISHSASSYGKLLDTALDARINRQDTGAYIAEIE
ncbi:MAG: type I-G CRISPR-associated protein Cas8g1/Csx17 [Candidatus Tyrphobacter sp.]